MKKSWGKCIILALVGGIIAVFAFILGKKSK